MVLITADDKNFGLEPLTLTLPNLTLPPSSFSANLTCTDPVLHVKSNLTTCPRRSRFDSINQQLFPFPFPFQSLLDLVTIEPPEVHKGYKQRSPQINIYQCARDKHKPTLSSMPDTAEGTRPAAPNPAEAITSPTSIARQGHESSLIAQPATFLLLPRGQNRAMQEKPMTALDKDQQSGLVSGPCTILIDV